MSEPFSPRTLVIVALASLVTGFTVVFGGGMLAYRAHTSTVSETTVTAQDPPVGPVQNTPAPMVSDAGGVASPVRSDAEAPGVPPLGSLVADLGADASANAPEATVTVIPGVVSRCFDQTAPAVIPGAACDALPTLDQHMQSHAPQIAVCGRGHGHLAFIMDFRISTSFVRAWGGPTSTIPNAGIVAACVRRVTAPLPLGQVTHAHDRYITVYGIDW